MMTFWLERYSKPASLVPSAVASVVAHTVLIGASVIATAGPGIQEEPLPTTGIARFLAPPDRIAAQRPRPEMIRYVALGLPEGIAGATAPAGPLTDSPRRISGLEAADASPRPALLGTDSIFSIVDVDSAATRYEWSAAPAFPPRMLAQSQNGYVRAEWVVDENGYADTLTFRLLEESHADFTKSVRDALPFMRFRPATMGATAVRQRVQQEFRFRISTTVVDTTRDTTRLRKPPP